MTLSLSRGMNEVTQRELSFLSLLWGLFDPRIAELREMPRSFSIKLHSETKVSDRLGMSGGRSPRHAQNPLSGERRKRLSITHHALSPPLSHHHLYIIHLINCLQGFYRVTMSLKRPFVPKSDVKQGFTTTSPGAQESKMSRTGPKGLKVVSNWKFCAELKNQRLTCRTWEVF